MTTAGGCFCVWPHPRYAQACAVDEWAGATPEAIEVHEFVEEWLPRLEKDGYGVAVFPRPAGVQAVNVDSPRLRSDLEDELALYE